MAMHYRPFSFRSIESFFLRRRPSGRVFNNVAHKFGSFHGIAGSEGGAGRSSFANPLAVKIVHALQLGDTSKASDLLSNASCGEHAFCADDFAYILGHCTRNPHPAFAMETWKIMEERNIVSDKCYLNIIRSLCKAKSLEEALAFVKCVGDQLQTSTLEKHRRVQIIKLLRYSFSDVIKACARTGNSMLAEQLIVQMQNLGVKPTRSIYDGFLKAVLLERGPSSGVELLKLMQKRNIKPYDYTLTALSVSCSLHLDLDLAEFLLSEASECKDVDPYNTYLAACRAADKPERAIKMLAKMKKRKIKLDIKTYELLFSMFVHVNTPYEEGNMLSRVYAGRRMKAIETDMLNNGVQHSQRSLKNLLRALGAEGMIRELMQYLRIAEQHAFTQDTNPEIEIYNIVLHSLAAAEQSHMAIEIFKNLKMYCYPLNTATYTIMIDCCSNLRCFKSASAILSMMIRDGFMPQMVTYCALIKILLDDDEFDEALNLLHQALIDGHQPDVLLFNTVLNRAFIKGRIDIIELIIELMHVWRIEPDPTTCHYVFNAYVEGEFMSTALEALEVLSLRMISEDQNVLRKTREEFEEDCVLAEDMKAEVSTMKLLGNSKENLCFALLNLRWCAIMGSEITWEPDQSPWSRRLASAFQSYTT